MTEQAGRKNTRGRMRTGGDPPGGPVQQQLPPPMSLFKRRLLRFKRFKRGYYSFWILLITYALSFALPLFVNSRALVVKHEGEYYFPIIQGYIAASTFGQTGAMGEPNYRTLKEQFREEGAGNWVILTPYPIGPMEDISAGNRAYSPPGRTHWLGTDDRGRDVFSRMAYGFNISISFAVILTIVNYTIGASIGALMGYIGGKFDLFFQRFIEIWGTMPFLYVVIIISAILRPNFLLLVGILALFGWLGMTYYMRTMFYQEKAKDYVAAGISTGVRNRTIIFKHILPNSLTPIITFFPFSMVGGIGSLVGLDYLGFGLPPPTPSWGEMVSQGLANITKWWLVMVPLGALFSTLLLVVFIGEAIREAFDPKVFSRLR